MKMNKGKRIKKVIGGLECGNVLDEQERGWG